MEGFQESYAEKFLNTTLPKKMSEKKREQALKRLHEKPIMLVNEVSNKKPKTKRKKSKIPRGIRGKKEVKSNPVYKYSDYETLRKLWVGYIGKLVFDGKPRIDVKFLQETLLKADYHGANIRVCESKCESYKGVSGTVVTETKNMFQIVTTDDKTMMIPKKNSIFEVKVCGYRVVILGDQFCIKPSHRLTKKFKNYVPYVNLLSG